MDDLNKNTLRRIPTKTSNIKNLLSGLTAFLAALGSDVPASAGELRAKEATRVEEVTQKERVFDYMKKLNSSATLKSGSLREMVHLFSMRRDEAATNGWRPWVPSFNMDRLWYPRFKLGNPEEGGEWPALRIRMRGKNGTLVATNAIRVGERRLVVPRSFMESTSGKTQEREDRTLPLVASMELPLKAEHAHTPILPVFPEIDDSLIKTGTYAVALGESQYVTEEVPNADVPSNSYRLTGFLVRLNDNPALQEAMRAFRSLSIPGKEEEENYTLDSDAFVMVGDPREWGAYIQRAGSGEDGLGQPVYVNPDGKGFRYMGILVDAGFLAEGGRLPQDSQSPLAPLYIIAGSSVIQKDIPQN